jgi:hypothetical protein
VSNRTLVELNHDYAPPRDDAGLLTWAQAMLNYLSSGDPKALPDGVAFLQCRHHSEGCPVQTLRLIRERGWVVAVHNDYSLGRGKSARQMTFWLFTNPVTGRFVKGEGSTDAEACERASRAIVDIANAEHRASRATRRRP